MLKRVENMKVTSSKKTLTTILTIVIIATATIVSTIPLAHAVTSYCFLSANPNPVGVGQTVVVSAWINPIPGGFGGS